VFDPSIEKVPSWLSTTVASCGPLPSPQSTVALTDAEAAYGLGSVKVANVAPLSGWPSTTGPGKGDAGDNHDGPYTLTTPLPVVVLPPSVSLTFTVNDLADYVAA
jgi:hypothetical protein